LLNEGIADAILALTMRIVRRSNIYLRSDIVTLHQQKIRRTTTGRGELFCSESGWTWAYAFNNTLTRGERG
jgi:hypothetical protein